jgi:hypothetical protein
MKIMAEYRLIRGIDTSTSTEDDYMALCLTWDGAELLDKIRADTIWGKVKQTAKSKGVDRSVDVVKALAKLALANTLGVEL